MAKFQLTNRRKEVLLYAVVWIVLFVLPLMGMVLHRQAEPDATFHWGGILRLWCSMLALLVAFLIHNFLLAPLAVYKHKTVAYICGLIVLFVAYFMANDYIFEKLPHKHHFDKKRLELMQKSGDSAHFAPPPFDDDDDDKAPGDTIKAKAMRHPHPHSKRPPMDIPMPIILFMLLIGINLGTKYYYKNQAYKQRLKELETESLTQQLEYLRYQVNPHFLMNTLNNIHALIDIEPETAKASIVELSKLLRYMLYEGAKARIPLQSELDFIQHYIKLMRLRYTDKVTINTDIQNVKPTVTIAPLLLIPFIENAFKHGVSYQHSSIIDIRVVVTDSKISFQCINSKGTSDSASKQEGGVGLTNVRKRLELIYGTDYTLNINDNDSSYEASLTIPVEEAAEPTNDNPND